MSTSKKLTLPLEVGKKYRNRLGEVVRIVATDVLGGDFPVLGLSITDDREEVESYTSEGIYCTSYESPNDLVEDYQEPRTLYAIYQDGKLYSTCSTRESAEILMQHGSLGKAGLSLIEFREVE